MSCSRGSAWPPSLSMRDVLASDFFSPGFRTCATVDDAHSVACNAETGSAHKAAHFRAHIMRIYTLVSLFVGLAAYMEHGLARAINGLFVVWAP